MNSYSDSGYQDASSGYLSSQSQGKAELRVQHSFPGAGTGTLVRKAEGQASAQVLTVAVCYCSSQFKICGCDEHMGQNSQEGHPSYTLSEEKTNGCAV